ncbi:MAG: ethanolamine utilization protein EutJ [candidate division Zixibacteria bacterium RBG_16_53_22]|nr:MAG: ethanolamine utilization protein EutJ [candidate division Zixibacteria bacterium RBG_16_53_22]
MRKTLGILTALTIGAMLLSCGGGAKQDEILIGEYGSLTGTTATFGQSTHNGLTLAVEEINNAGGVLGKKIKLLTEDDQSKPEEAATAVTKLITRDGAKAVIGEVASSRSLAAAPICQDNGIPMVSPASTNPEVTRKGDYIFRVCYIDPFQGEVLAKFAYNSLGLRNVAILKDVRNDYSVGLAQFFEETFVGLGGKIAATQAYSEGDTDFKAQLTALKGANPEAVFVPGYYTEGALIVKQARELNMTMPIIGGDGWDSSKLVEIGGEALNGSYFSTHYASDDTNYMVKNFVTKYKERYNETPDAMAALGYDAGLILCDAITRAGSTDGAAIRDALAATRGFRGVTGTISIDENRNARKSAVVIAVVDGKLQYKETIQP